MSAQEGAGQASSAVPPAEAREEPIATAQPQQQTAPQHQYQGKDQQPTPQQFPNNGPMPQMQAPGYEVPLQCLIDLPAIVDCPFCYHRVLTHTVENDSSMTLTNSRTNLTGLALGFACICLACICLACLPCLGGWFQDVDHHCPVCKQRVAYVPYGKPAHIFFPSGPMPQQYVMGPFPQYGPPQAGAPAPPQYERYA